VKVSVGKRSGRRSTAQDEINQQLVDYAKKHQRVVRLKGGDPMLFGRAQEEITYLQSHGIRVEVVPGITAALAASAELGVSLTERGRSRTVVFVTPRIGAGEAPSTWLKAVLAADTAAIYMAAGHAVAIAAALMDAGKPARTPIAVVANASLPEARAAYGTLEQLPELASVAGAAPALILIGEIYAAGVATARRAERCDAA
jgi:uroporphyrin-III C-methyltransferase